MVLTTVPDASRITICAVPLACLCETKSLFSELLMESVGQVLAKNNLLEDLKARGLKRVAAFTWKASAEKLLQIYQNTR